MNSAPRIWNSNMSDSNPQLMEKIFVRDAVREDANEIAGLIVYAWPVQEFLDMRPGMTVDGFIQFIQSFVEAEGTLYSYENTKVAVMSDDNGKERIVGAMNAYDGSLYSTLKQPILDRMAAGRFEVLGGVRVVAEDGKIVSAEIGGEPLDDEKIYGVATITFLLDGGDDVHVAKNALEVIVCGKEIYDVMMDYVKAETAAGRPVEYHKDGRVQIL